MNVICVRRRVCVYGYVGVCMFVGVLYSECI